MSYVYNTWMVGPRPMYHGPGFGCNNPAMRMNMAGPGQHRMAGMNQGMGGTPGMPTYRGFGGNNPAMRMNTPNQLQVGMIAGHRMGMPNSGYSSRELFKAAMIKKNPKWKTELCRNYEKDGKCKKGGNKCSFAHGISQLRGKGKKKKEEEERKIKIEEAEKKERMKMELESEKEKRKDLEKKVLKEEETQRTLWTMWKEERKKNDMLMKTTKRKCYNEDNEKCKDDDSEDDVENDTTDDEMPPLIDRNEALTNRNNKTSSGRIIKPRKKFEIELESHPPQKQKKKGARK